VESIELRVGILMTIVSRGVLTSKLIVLPTSAACTQNHLEEQSGRGALARDGL